MTDRNSTASGLQSRTKPISFNSRVFVHSLLLSFTSLISFASLITLKK